MQEEKIFKWEKGSMIKLFGKYFCTLGLLNVNLAFSVGMVASPWVTQNARASRLFRKTDRRRDGVIPPDLSWSYEFL